MTLGNNYRGGRRRRGPSAQRIIAWLIALTLILTAGIYAYRTGSALGTREARMLRAEISVLTDTIAGLQEDNDGLDLALDKQQRKNLNLLEQYNRDVPAEPIKRISELVESRIEEGLELERLEEVIRSMQLEWDCSDQPITRRFVVQTPTTPGGNDAVGFAAGIITVTGTGFSVSHDAGLPLAWFDPGQPVVINFTTVGGENTEISGLLPLHHSLIIDEKIYRFSILSGDTSFVNVVGLPCSYP